MVCIQQTEFQALGGRGCGAESSDGGETGSGRYTLIKRHGHREAPHRQSTDDGSLRGASPLNNTFGVNISIDIS